MRACTGSNPVVDFLLRKLWWHHPSPIMHFVSENRHTHPLGKGDPCKTQSKNTRFYISKDSADILTFFQLETSWLVIQCMLLMIWLERVWCIPRRVLTTLRVFLPLIITSLSYKVQEEHHSHTANHYQHWLSACTHWICPVSHCWLLPTHIGALNGSMNNKPTHTLIPHTFLCSLAAAVVWRILS